MFNNVLSSLGQISYAAGSTSLDPHGYRVLAHDDSQKFATLRREFPRVGELLQPNSVCISAYPAALGLRGFDAFIDSYLHPPTVIRAFRLALLNQRSVVFASQPLAGAELLLQVMRANQQMPRRLLWAVGGYYLPMSLERLIRSEMSRYGCQIEVLHCYGVAEIGHTCFAACERTVAGLPLYRLVDPGVEAMRDDETGRLRLGRDGRWLLTEDQVKQQGGHWLIRSGANRLHPRICRFLESWSDSQWLSRTGYLAVHHRRFQVQLREGVHPERPAELRLHRFWERHGGTWLTKPKWSLDSQRLLKCKPLRIQHV